MRLRLLAVAFAAACASPPCLAEEVVNLYAWPDYFPPAVIASFEHDTGIQVVYSTFDSNDVLEAKLSAGSSGYDVVVPNAVPHLARQIPAALMYLGRDGAELGGDAGPAAAALVDKVRPFIRTLDSSNYITELASGSLCLTLGYSGDAKIAADRARDAGNGVRIGYAIPTQGASVYIDSLAIPKDAPHLDAAYAFINYMLRPDMAAQATNATGFPNANAAATPLVDAAVRNDPGLYPGPDVRRRLVPGHPQSPTTARLLSRIWTQIRSGL